ncbi:GNAT family N-acetyltransferase [Streptomyces sp. NRRL F-5123]|uniref:GNAT family N-acetyltransferase n=1 Tax=Streptomyces sp. NRRL F-5123 TaxID=1463856 RepID=UPI000D145A04|nr:GNAT family N-acetyltransferase [Streptomyces sp. NRRL F-5123]
MSTSLPPRPQPSRPHTEDPPAYTEGTTAPTGSPAQAGPPAPTGPHVLDNAVWAALSGPHRHLAETVGQAARYRTDVSPFVAVADSADPRSWADLAALVGPGNSFAMAGVPAPPDGWATGQSGQGVQLVATALETRSDPEAEALGPADVPEMLELVGRAKPGPFLPRTVEMGAYYGIRREGRLVAMAGERLRLSGWTEISAVCTDERHRGQGLATRLVRHVADGITARGDTPFLHAAAVNTRAVRLYESIGFTLRRTTVFHLLKVPGGR